MSMSLKEMGELNKTMETLLGKVRGGDNSIFESLDFIWVVKTMSLNWKNAHQELVDGMKQLVIELVKIRHKKEPKNGFKMTSSDGGFVISGENFDDKMPVFIGDVSDKVKNEVQSWALGLINMENFYFFKKSQLTEGDIFYYGCLPNGISFVIQEFEGQDFRGIIHYSDGSQEIDNDYRLNHAGVFRAIGTKYGVLFFDTMGEPGEIGFSKAEGAKNDGFVGNLIGKRFVIKTTA